MTADKPSPLVPKLRFPEFGNMPGWGLTQLSDVLDYEQPGKYIVEDTSYQNAGTPVLTANKGFVLGHTAETDGIYQQVPVIIFDDFTTDAKYVDFPFKVKSSAIKILTSRGEDELRLVYELMSRIRFDSTQHKRYFISQYQYLKIPLPGKSEQKKITDCLGSLDDLIAAAGRKLEALRQHKQGLMQQLFPQPGESVPRLRFPEFEDAPEWQSRELGLMTSKIGSGVTPRGGEKNYRSKGRPFVRSQNVGWGELILDNVVHIDEDTHASFAATEVEEGDVLLNISGASIGRSAVADARIAGGNVNQHVCIIRGLSEQIQACFLSQYLISKHGQDQINSCQAGGNRQGLNFGQIRSFLIPQPRDVAEQERIADCLRAADIIRATQAQRISALKRQKQGSLQQLFPSPEG